MVAKRKQLQSTTRKRSLKEQLYACTRTLGALEVLHCQHWK